MIGGRPGQARPGHDKQRREERKGEIINEMRPVLSFLVFGWNLSKLQHNIFLKFRKC